MIDHRLEDRRRERGRCPHCGQRPPRAAGKYFCDECLAYFADRRHTFVRLSICPDCMADAPAKHTYCDHCRAKHNARSRARRANLRAEGLCHDCGRPTKRNKTLCAACSMKRLPRNRWAYHIARLDGICVDCRKQPSAKDRTRCEECLERVKLKMRARRAAIKEQAA